MENSEFEFEIITPLNIFFKDQVQSIVVNTPNGKIGIQSLHEPLISCVEEGKIEVKVKDQWRNLYVSKGFMEVETDTVLIYTDKATDFENKKEIDLKETSQINYEATQRKKNKLERTKMESFINKTLDNLKSEKNIRK